MDLVRSCVRLKSLLSIKSCSSFHITRNEIRNVLDFMKDKTDRASLLHKSGELRIYYSYIDPKSPGNNINSLELSYLEKVKKTILEKRFGER